MTRSASITMRKGDYTLQMDTNSHKDLTITFSTPTHTARLISFDYRNNSHTTYRHLFTDEDMVVVEELLLKCKMIFPVDFSDLL